MTDERNHSMSLTRLKRLQQDVCTVPSCLQGLREVHVQWAHTSQEQLENMRTIARSSLRQRHGASLEKAWLTATAATGGIAMLWLALHSFPMAEADALDFFAMVCGILAMGFLSVLFVGVPGIALAQAVVERVHGQPAEILSALQPLSERGDECVKTLELLVHPSAQAYRNHVLSTGREMVVRDRLILEALAEFDRSGPRQLQLEQACRQLHGLEPLTLVEG